MRVLLLCAGTAVALAGCAVGPDYHRPDAVMSAAFKEAPPAGWKMSTPSDALDKGPWWSVYQRSRSGQARTRNRHQQPDAQAVRGGVSRGAGGRAGGARRAVSHFVRDAGCERFAQRGRCVPHILGNGRVRDQRRRQRPEQFQRRRNCQLGLGCVGTHPAHGGERHRQCPGFGCRSRQCPPVRRGRAGNRLFRSARPGFAANAAERHGRAISRGPWRSRKTSMPPAPPRART